MHTVIGRLADGTLEIGEADLMADRQHRRCGAGGLHELRIGGRPQTAGLLIDRQHNLVGTRGRARQRSVTPGATLCGPDCAQQPIGRLEVHVTAGDIRVDRRLGVAAQIRRRGPGRRRFSHRRSRRHDRGEPKSGDGDRQCESVHVRS